MRYDGNGERFFMVMDEKVVVVHGEEGSCVCTLLWRREEGVGWGNFLFLKVRPTF